MPHIRLPDDVPGILGPLTQYPETGEPLSALAQALLRGPSSLTPAERELIAAYVSTGNDCTFCASSHSAAARHLLDAAQRDLVAAVCADPETAPVSPKLRALLAIAGKVRESGRAVASADIERAREAGADDKAIHDTVLIAAAFCMYNRYVDGLATWTPEQDAMYDQIGADLAARGYVRS